MSDKAALSRLPDGWTGGAPDADAFHAMADAALAALPDIFKPHIRGVVVAIEEFADDETLASLGIEHPYDLTGLYEGRPLTERSIEKLRVPIVAGGANNQLATAADGQRIHDRGIVYAPDYVINAGGIINVALEYLGQGSQEEVESRIHLIPGRLAEIWAESKASGTPASTVADHMAQKLIGRR
jgi:hypothetical protein